MNDFEEINDMLENIVGGKKSNELFSINVNMAGDDQDKCKLVRCTHQCGIGSTGIVNGVVVG